MSRYYRMEVRISPVSADEFEDALDVFGEMWNCEDGQHEKERSLAEMCGEAFLRGGETGQEFALRLARAVWDRLGRFVEVCVDATFLEDLPCESHSVGRSEYDRYIAADETPPDEGEETV